MFGGFMKQADAAQTAMLVENNWGSRLTHSSGRPSGRPHPPLDPLSVVSHTISPTPTLVTLYTKPNESPDHDAHGAAGRRLHKVPLNSSLEQDEEVEA
ncbi:hypothetical protein EYF80_002715 [Liparis tanakae]|uniref:Uncharacterized protein n=1 Tax=Liparis tanakae TaxID=230148 RepID=A0A4Z2JA24_9TELE|nr:hypothetical protein EYF80_002715 [Liparis tanakae]